MKQYKHIFFDLDHTLWDYDANASEALSELFEHYQFAQHGIASTQLVSTFFEVNEELWDLYNSHKIQRKDIRERRFPFIFKRLGIDKRHMPVNIEQEYIALAPTKPNIFPDAHEVLDYLKTKYELHIITNGFDDIQAKKLKYSNLAPYFDVIITSETANSRKPSPDIFNLALERTGGELATSMMIGDNIKADIAGAVAVGMDHVWFNPNKLATNVTVQYQISNLLELKSIL
ncbi:YjjG family noncanonical pyrimidine nucleotidase [Roseivirga pacifica]|uniref:YjjG family noncanonical pyrimidine nucleotidase n=1 Tax=Roseivirga pacifica TaxID=1267423 RepID=UPI002096581A|nr:YjjG family noncanonical pyrimidine nucleotidase [Roseivirga pacifica]